MTIEPDTIFERLRDAGKLKLPDEELSLAMFAATRELTEARGLPAYEVSNHARRGGESRHNLIYWRTGEYAGIGPGAHGRIVTGKVRLAQETERHPEMWLTQVESEGHGLVDSSPLSREEQGDEFLLMGLRLQRGHRPAPLRADQRPGARPRADREPGRGRVHRNRRARPPPGHPGRGAAARHRGRRRRGVAIHHQ